MNEFSVSVFSPTNVKLEVFQAVTKETKGKFKQ